MQATYDPNNIAALLQQYPYHIDSLMAMFDLYRVRPCQASVSRTASPTRSKAAHAGSYLK